jgi:HSP20 family protein
MRKGDITMAKKEKEGNGAKVPVQKSGQALATRPTEHSSVPAFRTEHPLRRLREEIDGLFDHFFGRWPSAGEPMGLSERLWDTDVEETDTEIVVRAEAPGFEPKDFDIEVSGNTVTIRAEHKEEAEEKDEGGYRRWEQRYDRFQHSIPLSTAVDADKVQAHYRNGILDLHLPRTEPSPRRRIEVKT